MATVTLLGIRQPFIRQEGLGAIAVQKDPVPENYNGGSNVQAWLKDSFVYTSGTGASVVLNSLATNGTVIYGQAPAAALGSPAASVPPRHLFGVGGADNMGLHYPFDVRDRIIEMNLASTTLASIGTVNGASWAGGGTDSGPAIAAGQQYGVIVPTSGTYNKINFIDVKNTTNKLFEIVALAPGEIATSANSRVWAKVISSVIQG